MEKYVVGLPVDGYNYYDINDNGIYTIKDSIVFIILNKESSNQLYSYYNALKTIILNNNRPILIMLGSESKIRKQLCMLMVSYKMNDIYYVETGEVDSDYLDMLIDRRPTEEEVRTFIGSDLSAYGEINDILLEITSAIEEYDYDKVNNIISSKKDIINSSIYVIDYMKKAIDNINTGEFDTKINELKLRIDKLSDELESTKNKLKLTEEDNINLKKANELAQKEAFVAKSKAADLEYELNNKGPIIKNYAEVQTSLVKCRVKSIIYFKEISYVRYTNTFILKLAEVISKIKKLKVKVLIYDNKNAFLNSYKPLSVVGFSEFMSNRDAMVNSIDKLVIIEPNPAIIEDILKADYDVVIIYDRLKQVTDIVTGNCVYKYWVINSTNDYNSLMSTLKMDKQYIITRSNREFPESIALVDILDFTGKTPSGKTASYMEMRNADKKKIIEDVIFGRTNVNSIQPGR